MNRGGEKLLAWRKRLTCTFLRPAPPFPPPPLFPQGDGNIRYFEVVDGEAFLLSE
jgi:hypothetical protein